MTSMRRPPRAESRAPELAEAGAAGGGVAAARPNAPVLGLLALGHLVVDMNQGALPALLPFLKSAFGLSYTAAGVVLLVANLTSSLIQPAFGYLSDRAARRALLPWALVLASGGLALAGWAPSYGTLLVVVVIAGLGIAAYHPEGYRTANQVAGDRKATGLSLFSIGGNVGIALGPPAITALVTTFGLPGTLGMLAPGLVVAALIAAVLPAIAPAPAPRGTVARGPAASAIDMPGAMALLIGVVTIRSWSQLGLVTYIPFLYLDVLHADARVVGPLLFLFLGAGAVGTLVGGPIADRWGARRYITISMLLSAPLLAGFLWDRGGPVSTLCLAATGFVLVSSFSVTVALGQAYLPRRLGMAAGLIVGLAIGTGGIGVALFGWVADHWGLWTTLRLIAILPLAGFALALRLPEPRR
jgi:FSR family fosmidomycin resistance protein-like MFS transporter